MANFQNNAITESGIRLRSHVDMGAVFTATKIVIGSGYIPSGKTAKTMTDVVSPVKELDINKKERTPDGKVVFGGVYTNEDIATEFYFRELALYAKAVYPDGTEVDEVLYSYGNAAGDAELMAAYSTSTVVERQMDIVTFIGNDAQVDLTIESGVYVTNENLARVAAPAGYGLGTIATYIADLNQANVCGWYFGNSETVNGPKEISESIVVRVEARRATEFVQTVTSTGRLSAVRSTSDGGTTWSEWEYINPSLTDGVEYRTTERINNKAVYKKNVNGVIQYRLDGETTWKEYAAAVGAVAKTGDQTMTGSLSGRAFLVSDGYMNGDYGVDGALKRVEIRAIDPSNGAMGALLVNPSGLLFMDGGGYEYRVIHEGNMAQFLGVAPATVE